MATTMFMSQSQGTRSREAMATLNGTPQSVSVQQFMSKLLAPSRWSKWAYGWMAEYDQRGLITLDERTNEAILSGDVCAGWINGKQPFTQKHRDLTVPLLKEVMDLILLGMECGWIFSEMWYTATTGS